MVLKENNMTSWYLNDSVRVSLSTYSMLKTLNEWKRTGARQSCSESAELCLSRAITMPSNVRCRKENSHIEKHWSDLLYSSTSTFFRINCYRNHSIVMIPATTTKTTIVTKQVERLAISVCTGRYVIEVRSQSSNCDQISNKASKCKKLPICFLFACVLWRYPDLPFHFSF